MASQKSASPFGRYRWRWIMVLAGFISWISLGCSPASLSMMLMPWMDDKLDPEYKLFAQDKELTLVILANFSPPQLHPDLQPVEMELPEKVASFLRKRCVENKHKLKIVPYAESRTYQVKQLVDGNVSPFDIGKKFKADYVLDLTIHSVSLYEKRSNPPLFRGEAEIKVKLFKVDTKECPLDKTYRGEGNPTPFDAGGMSVTDFRDRFLTKMAGDISKMFIAYPPQERAPFDSSTGNFTNR